MTNKEQEKHPLWDEHTGADPIVVTAIHSGHALREELEELEQMAPDLRLINLETAVTRSDSYWPRKGINYRMHPDNFPCIEAAGIDACILANNHVLDWGYKGLEETLDTVTAAGMKSVGAGKNSMEAKDPAVFELSGRRRVIVLAFAHTSSGVPPEWRASPELAGVFLIESLNDAAIEKIASQGNMKVPEGTATVYIEAHDKVHGWTPSRLKVDLSKASNGRLSVEAQ